MATEHKGARSSTGGNRQSGSRNNSGTRSRSGSQRSTSSAKKSTSGNQKRGNTSGRQNKAASEGIWSRYGDEIILILTLVLSILLVLSNFQLCGPVGEFINEAAFGLFGFLAYLFPVLLFFGVAFYLSNKDDKIAIHKIISTACLFLVMSAFLQMVFYGNSAEIPVKDLYLHSAAGKDGGGFFGGGIAKLLCMVLDVTGTYIVLVAIMALLLMFVTEKLLFAFLGNVYREQRRARRERREQERALRAEQAEIDEMERRREERLAKRMSNDRSRIEKTSGFDESDRNAAADRNGADSRNSTGEITGDGRNTASGLVPELSGQTEPENGRKKKKRKPRSYTFPLEEERRADSVEMKEMTMDNLVIHRGDQPAEDDFQVDMSGVFDNTDAETATAAPFYEAELQKKFGKSADAGAVNAEPDRQLTAAGFHRAGASEPTPFEVTDAAAPEPKYETDYSQMEAKTLDPLEAEKERILAAKSIEGNKALESYGNTNNSTGVEHAQGQAGNGLEHAASGGGQAAGAGYGTGAAGAGVVSGGGATDMGISPAIKPVEKPYHFPPTDLLSKPAPGQRGTSNRELQETAMTLQKTLDSFGVRVTVTNVSCGPAVTRYELQPERGVKVSKITGLADDIKLNLAAADIRIEAPIPGKAAVGIEVPNKENSMVYLRELLESNNFKEHKSKVAFAVGKDIGGQAVVTDIAKMPHLLIAGATGSGKSVCINTLIMSILYKADPNDVKLIMVDPKVVELSVYNGIPHLLIPVVTDPKKASGALNWAVMEMTDRYNKFAELGVRDMKGYNDKIASVAEYKEDPRYVKMPQIVIIVDELADLMMVAPGEVEDSICRLAQLARAAGIHLVIATQRPSVNVITGLIKANVPSRIAFAVSSGIDSRTILDMVGAEKLLGKGDMLFFPTGYPKPVRVQGAFVSDKEVTAVVDYLTKQNEGMAYNPEIIEKVANAQPAPSATGGDAAYGNPNGQDEYFAEAGKFIIEKDKASIGMLQRVYKIGFNRAARIMDQLSDAGVVGPEEGTKPRKVLMSLEEFENYLEQN